MKQHLKSLVESDQALRIASVCKFYHVPPSSYLHIEDDVEAFAMDEALMVLYLTAQDKALKEQEAEQERKSKMQKSLDAPGTQTPVRPPSVAELKRMAEGN